MDKLKSLLVVMAIAACAFMIVGCNGEELTKLQGQSLSLTKENTELKTRIASFEKALADQQAAVAANATLTSQYEQCKKDLEAAIAKETKSEPKSAKKTSSKKKRKSRK